MVCELHEVRQCSATQDVAKCGEPGTCVFFPASCWLLAYVGALAADNNVSHVGVSGCNHVLHLLCLYAVADRSAVRMRATLLS